MRMEMKLQDQRTVRDSVQNNLQYNYCMYAKIKKYRGRSRSTSSMNYPIFQNFYPIDKKNIFLRSLWFSPDNLDIIILTCSFIFVLQSKGSFRTQILCFSLFGTLLPMIIKIWRYKTMKIMHALTYILHTNVPQLSRLYVSVRNFRSYCTSCPFITWSKCLESRRTVMYGLPLFRAMILRGPFYNFCPNGFCGY